MDDTARDGLDPELFEEIVETVGVGVAIYDDSGRYRYVNRAYADILGTDREALVGAAIWEIVPGFDRERFDDYWASFADGETRLAEVDHAIDGTATPVSALTTRRLIDGHPYNFGTIRDRTDRKRREQELREKNERLEAFAGIVSHDLRNPLSVAKGYLELLETDIDRDEIELIGSALDRMDILIEDLLTLAREGRSVTDPKPVSLSAVAGDAWGQIETGAATLDADADRTVVADRKRLQQLLENLFRNSVEHGSTSNRPQADGDRPGGGSGVDHDGAADPVTVRVGTLASGEGFYVADDGPGIPEPERDRVFEPTYSTDEDGTGFGLAIVDEIAAAHGWAITVVESDDGGARFEFRGTDGADADGA